MKRKINIIKLITSVIKLIIAAIALAVAINEAHQQFGIDAEESIIK